MLGVARNLLVGLVGAVGAVILATALSPLAPVGEARLAEPVTGISFDALVLSLGSLAIVVVVVALGMWPAMRATRGMRTDNRGAVIHPSSVVVHLAAAARHRAR